MTRDEARAFGIPEDKMKEFQASYNRDLHKAAGRFSQMEENEASTIRSAIFAMLKLIKRPDTLRKILVFVNRAYWDEPNTAKPQA